MQLSSGRMIEENQEHTIEVLESQVSDSKFVCL